MWYKQAVLLVLFILMLAGCGKSGDDCLVELERRVTLLERRLADVESAKFRTGERMLPLSVDRGERRGHGAVRRTNGLYSVSADEMAERQRKRREIRKRLEERREKARMQKLKKAEENTDSK